MGSAGGAGKTGCKHRPAQGPGTGLSSREPLPARAARATTRPRRACVSSVVIALTRRGRREACWFRAAFTALTRSGASCTPNRRGRSKVHTKEPPWPTERRKQRSSYGDQRARGRGDGGCYGCCSREKADRKGRQKYDGCGDRWEAGPLCCRYSRRHLPSLTHHFERSV